MKRSLLILVALAGCTSQENFPPSLTAAPTGDGTGAFMIEYQRGTDHDFSGLTATINGIDLGSAQISEGGAPQQVLSSPTPSSAIWQIDVSKVGNTVHVVIDEGGEQFTLDETFDGTNVVVTGCSSNLSC